MKKTLFAITALSALCAAMPAAAQYRDRYSNQQGFDASFQARLDALETRIDAGVRQGSISRREAGNLHRELTGLGLMEDRLSSDGLTRVERDQLQRRLRLVRDRIRVADGGAYDRDDRWTDYEEDDRSGYYGRGGPNEDVCEERGGIGGLVDNALGRDNCFRVGQRVGSGLYAVPNDYRDRYRDGRGVYYRSDGRRIYEIDARTDTVIEIHRIPRD